MLSPSSARSKTTARLGAAEARHPLASAPGRHCRPPVDERSAIHLLHLTTCSGASNCRRWRSRMRTVESVKSWAALHAGAFGFAALIGMVAALSSPLAAAEIYKCVAKDGAPLYQNFPCAI